MLIYPNASYSELSKLDSKLFTELENDFHEFIENSNPCMEYEEMYYGEDAIYSKKGAILQCIEEIIDEAKETNKPVDTRKFDTWGIFQG